MKNIERCGFSNANAAMEFAVLHGLMSMNPVSWGTQIWLDYTKWLCEESEPGALCLKDDEPKPVESVNHPAHYSHRSGYDAIVWIDRFKMDFCVGNCFKYLFRRGLKPGESFEQDGEKAKWYFRHEVERFSSYFSWTDKRLFDWEKAKRMVAQKLLDAFGPPGKLEDGSPDWNVGGCDMPEAVEFLEKECLTMKQEA